MRAFDFPGGKRFAFTILDDTDVATVENVKPVYQLLERLGMRTTKTVWPVGCPEGSRNFGSSQTLEDPAYLTFVRHIVSAGFEITWHGATMESSPRERTALALERFRELLGHYPKIHANHAENLENIYWGTARIDVPILKYLFKRLGDTSEHSFGDREGSPYWWVDLCSRHIVYARNLTFGSLNLASINPSMPYHDPSRPLVPYWFSCADAEDAPAFAALLHPRNQDQLEASGGFCILTTHFGKGFVSHGAVEPYVEKLLEALSCRSGWFPTTSELLDWLLARRNSAAISSLEWQRMQWYWARDSLVRRLRKRWAPALAGYSSLSPP